MLHEPTEVSFFAIQANFLFTVINFTEVKFDKDPLNELKTIRPENQY